jgi:hypothetical protein
VREDRVSLIEKDHEDLKTKIKSLKEFCIAYKELEKMKDTKFKGDAVLLVLLSPFGSQP